MPPVRLARRGSWLRSRPVRIAAIAVPAVAGALAAFVGGGWIAAVVGGAAAVLALAGDRLWARRDDQVQRREARAEVLDPLWPPPGARDERGVFDLLIASRRVMPFQGRRKELAELDEWCFDPAGHPLLVVGGGAGVGKTRLVLEFADSLPPGWVSGRLRPGQGEAAVDRLVAAGDPTLLVVDDADTRLDVAVLLNRLATVPANDRPRVVLIARNAAGLLGRLRVDLSDEAAWLADRRPLELALHGQRGDRRRWFEQAVERFAHRLGRRVPAVEEVVGTVAAVREPMLVLHARALLLVLDGARPHSAVSVAAEKVADGLLRHEMAWWEGTAELADWAVDGFGVEIRQRCVLALTVRGAADIDAAVRVLQRIPDLTDGSQADLRNAVRWVMHLYPLAVGCTPVIRPDLLGDWFCVSGLTRSPELAAALLADLDPAEAERVLNVLVRASMTFPDALPLLVSAVRGGDIEATVTIAVRTMVSLGSTRQMDGGLADMLTSHPLPVDQVREIDNLIPGHRLPLTRAAIGRQLVAAARVDGDPARLARALTNLGNRLWALGQHRDAHTATDEAVILWRRLAVDNPTHQASLAGALNLLGANLSALGQHRDAHIATDEAVTVWRRLAVDNPTHQASLARALTNLGIRLWALGQHRDAHTATDEAVTVWRRLAVDKPVHEPDLARAITNLGNTLSALGQHRDAYIASDEAVTLWRRLTVDNPAHEPDLARAVTNLGTRRWALGQHRDAHTATDEAVTLWRRLAADNPVHQPDLASALTNLGNSLSALGQHRDAYVASDEAVTLYRRLAVDNPAHQPDFARALANLGNRLSALGQHRDAHTATDEAVTLWRRLAADNPAHQPSLAGALNLLGAHLSALGQHRDAHTATDEAVTLYRRLAVDNPAHQPDLASALTNLAVDLCSLGRHDTEFDVRREATLVWQALADADPDLYGERHQQSLASTRRALSNHDQVDDAIRYGLASET